MSLTVQAGVCALGMARLHGRVAEGDEGSGCVAAARRSLFPPTADLVHENVGRRDGRSRQQQSCDNTQQLHRRRQGVEEGRGERRNGWQRRKEKRKTEKKNKKKSDSLAVSLGSSPFPSHSAAALTAVRAPPTHSSQSCRDSTNSTCQRMSDNKGGHTTEQRAERRTNGRTGRAHGRLRLPRRSAGGARRPSRRRFSVRGG